MAKKQNELFKFGDLNNTSESTSLAGKIDSQFFIEGKVTS